MAQNRIPRGQHGQLVAKQQPNGQWQARVQIRDIDGRVRSVRVSDRTKGAATRRLERRLAERVDPTITGVTPETTFDERQETSCRRRPGHR